MREASRKSTKMFLFVCLVAVAFASSHAEEAKPMEMPPAEMKPMDMKPIDMQPLAMQPNDRSPLCKSRNSYYNVEASCDYYIECRDYIAHEMLCPDGLHFNPAAVWPNYPCGYPADVSCVGRGSPQEPQPTAECPHRYGFFASPLASETECGHYRMCVEGNPIDMMCPTGLAFNVETSRCDWPEMVPSCNANAYLGFTCPEVPLGEDGEVPVVNYKYGGNCFAFFSCEGRRARLLTCDAGMAFDELTRKCVDADKVKCLL